jgi:putative ABC transport system permease protein
MGIGAPFGKHCGEHFGLITTRLWVLHCHNVYGQDVAMVRVILAQVRRRVGRSLALVLGVLLATTGFTVLTGSTATSRLRATETVDANFRAAYDVLVRPKDTRATLEEERQLVRPNFLSGQYGGIAPAQVDAIRAVEGIEIAAPIAMLGFVHAFRTVKVDITDLVDPDARQQLFRFSRTWLGDRGMSKIDDYPLYVYLTRNPLYALDIEYAGAGRVYTDGTKINGSPPDCSGFLEHLPGGQKKEICYWQQVKDGDGTSAVERTGIDAHQILPDGTFRYPESGLDGSDVEPTKRLVISLAWNVMVPVAAIDPVSEARLVGLDRAVVSGRYLTAADKAGPGEFGPSTPNVDNTYVSVPSLEADQAFVDEDVAVEVGRLGPDAVSLVPGSLKADLVPALANRPAQPTGVSVRTAGDLDFSTAPGAQDGAGVWLSPTYRGGPVEYDVDADRTLRPRTVPADLKVWWDEKYQIADRPPVFALDNGFRAVTKAPPPSDDHAVKGDPVGHFDPTKLPNFSALSAVPLETYQAPQADGADARTRELLGDRPLLPTSNPAGYLAMPPLVLVPLAALPALLPPGAQLNAPVSAVRVRVAGVTGFDELSRERVRRVAEDIAAATGLEVDITLGSSPAPQRVALAAGKFGRPALTVTEGWSRKGVAAAIVQAIDRKSAILFGLILLVCALFLTNAVAAAVRDRRRELAVLSCLGWSRSRLTALIAGEVVLLGVVAGVAGAGLSLALGRGLGLTVSTERALLAAPVAFGLALLASRGGRARPAAALHPSVVRPGRWTRRRRTVLGLAMGNLWRVPGRTLLGIACLAVGVGGLTVLAAVTWAFHGTATGSLLGDAVSVRVRGVDVLAVAATVLLGLFAVADVLYLNVRDRASELAALRATGWSEGALGRLVAYEGLGIGLIGTLIGAGAGVAGTARFAGTVSDTLLWTTGGVVLVGIVAAALTTLVPASLQRRIPMSTLLAEE